MDWVTMTLPVSPRSTTLVPLSSTKQSAKREPNSRELAKWSNAKWELSRTGRRFCTRHSPTLVLSTLKNPPATSPFQTSRWSIRDWVTRRKVKVRISRLKVFQESRISPRSPHRCKAKVEVSHPHMRKVTKVKRWSGTCRICKIRSMQRELKHPSSFLASTWPTKSKRRRKVGDCTILMESRWAKW